MTKAELAAAIDAYADAKASGNKYLVQKMIEELEGILNGLFGPDSESAEGAEIPEVPEEY
jgi:hypothetical protein